MKVIYKLIAAASIAVSALTGCQEEQFRGNIDPNNYYASVEPFSTDTKTELGEGGSVMWMKEDHIAVFKDEAVGQAYQVLDAYVGKSSGEFVLVEGLTTIASGAVIEGNIAVYPFDEGISVKQGVKDTYTISGIEFPPEQIYLADSFSDKAFPMAAVSPKDSKDLSFKNIGGVLKLSLTGSYLISQITLTGNSGELLSGSATVTISSGGIPSVQMSEDASTSITIICDPAVQLDPETATDFFISIPPTQFKSGFKVTILDKEGKEYGVATHKANAVKRSSILTMPETTPESLDSLDLTPNTFCSVDFIEGWTETRFGGNGTIVFVKEDEQGRMSHSLILLPDEEHILMPIYVRYDENEIPSYMSFMDTEIYIDGYTHSTVDFTLAVEDAIWSIKGVPCNELIRYSLQTRAWSDNTAIKNACAVGNLVVGVAGVAGGVVMMSASGVGAVMTGGTTVPISVAGIALGVMNIKGGCDSIVGSLETIFGPPDQKQSTYVKDALMGIGMEKLSDAIKGAPKNEFLKSKLPSAILKEPADLGKLGRISYWAGFIFSSIDEAWGKTYTKTADLAQVHQNVNVVTGRADNVTKNSAELYGYVSPLATAPFGNRILTEIYIIIWEKGDDNNKRNRSVFNSDGGIITLEFINLEPDTEYCYQIIFEDLENKIYRFGDINTFKTKGEESTLREKLIKLYNDTDGDNWINNENWCSDKPIEDWYGIHNWYNEDYYYIDLSNNNLVGNAVLNDYGTGSIGEIDVSGNNLTSLDLSESTALQRLNCNNNPLQGINLSRCTSLTDLGIDYYDDHQAKMTGSLNLSGCTALTHLICWDHQLTSLDLSGCTALTDLRCENNQLTSLDLSECTALKNLWCDYNKLTSLDLSECTALTDLRCEYNQLISLDLSGYTALTDLRCKYNQLISLDLSGCTALEGLDCAYNPFQSINLSECTSLDGFLLSYYFVPEIKATGSLNLSGCTALTDVRCEYNELTAIDLSGCSALTYMSCTGNQLLTSLDLSECTALKNLWCDYNKLTSLDLSECTALEGLHCNNNQLTSLNISGNPNLIYLYCQDNCITQEITSEYKKLIDFSYDARFTNYWHDTLRNSDGDVIGCDFGYTDNKIGWWNHGEPESKHSWFH